MKRTLIGSCARPISQSIDFVWSCKAGPSAAQSVANAPHLGGLVGSERILSIVAGDVREQSTGRTILLFFRQFAELLDCLLK